MSSEKDAFVRRGAFMPDVIVTHVQVGWLGPYGIVPGGLDVDPSDDWEPIYVIRRRTEGAEQPMNPKGVSQ